MAENINPHMDRENKEVPSLFQAQFIPAKHHKGLEDVYEEYYNKIENKYEMTLNKAQKEIDRHEETKNLHVPGAKDDSEKPDLDLVLGGFAKALMEVGRVGTFGAKKYTENGWKEVPNAKRRYSSALLRHTFQSSEGELYDNDSGLLHDAHAAWNALAKLQFTILELEKRDGSL